MTENTDVEEFYQEHCGKGGLVLVEIIEKYGDGANRLELFSSLQKAHDWADTLDVEGDYSALFSPRFVDFPEYGESFHARNVQ